MTAKPSIIEIAIPLYLNRTFHYIVPERLLEQAISGRRALVPFGRRKLTGYILAKVAQSEIANLKEIIDILDEESLWTPLEMEFFRWVASYYQHPLGEVIRTALPSGINIQTGKSAASGQEGSLSVAKKVRQEKFYLPAQPNLSLKQPSQKAFEILTVIKDSGDISAIELRKRFGVCTVQLKRLTELGLCRVENREVYRDPFKNSKVKKDVPRTLHTHQKAALDAVSNCLSEHKYAPFLLYGVTGSGKTEVYLQAIMHALELGKNALVLVPEIALTPQLTERFQARFDCKIAILHSGLSDGERYDEWRRIRRGLARIVIGARSAIFAPLGKLGIIIVDEEHESSFKQSDGLRYNARDLALVRGRMENAAVVLGSATPLITSIYAANQGRLTLLELPQRVEGRPMPLVELVSMKGEKETLSPKLANYLIETFALKQQSIVFLNRRGFATFLTCPDCGKSLSCPNCSVTLTYHRQRGQSLCHYCDYSIPAPGICPSCGSMTLTELGAGTEKLEDNLKELLPDSKIIRMDSDTTSGKGSHERLLSRMHDGSADILVGTQMIAKGHDFPEVTLVGVINAESSLGMPDFRAAERTFQLLSQVTGRAGRGKNPGRVVVQAMDTEHYAIKAAAEHDAAKFYKEELEFRKEAGYPPFSFLAAFGISGLSEQTVSEQSETIAQLLIRLKSVLNIRVEILGPAPSPIYRLRNRFRRQILLKSQNRTDLHRLLYKWREETKNASTIRIAVDIDPVDMM